MQNICEHSRLKWQALFSDKAIAEHDASPATKVVKGRADIQLLEAILATPLETIPAELNITTAKCLSL